MRTIKFRGKDRKSGEWFFGNLYDADNRGRTHICSLERGSLDVDPSTVGQFAGLFDKNGKEIYEGDIVQSKLKRARKYDERLVVCFGKLEWKVKNANGSTTSLSLIAEYHTIEVIGNIHDNPELLKGGAE